MDDQQKYSTKQVNALCKALEERGIKTEREYWDGYKHVDIYIPEINLNIEVDGLQHLIDPKQIQTDLKRQYYSDIHKIYTIHINNNVLIEHKDQIADAIAEIVKENIKK